MPVHAVVDLRPQFGEVRHQGPRPTCMAFTASDAHAFARGKPDQLSVEYAFFHAVQRKPVPEASTGVAFSHISAAIALQLPRMRQPGHRPVRSEHWTFSEKHPVGEPCFGRLSQELETAIFRIVQESVTNIHRHSESAVARIRISRSGRNVRLEVEDKGKGIPLEKRSEMESTGIAGVGIRGMRERIRQLGGTLEINSDGRGTLILARLPIGKTVSTAMA